MSTNFEDVMRRKSEEGLMDYLNNYKRYVPDAIIAAVQELKSRGKNFTESELEEIRAKIEKRRKQTMKTKTRSLQSPTQLSQIRCTELYSKSAINGFSILFSPIFGAILLASNVADSGKKWIVISFWYVLHVHCNSYAYFFSRRPPCATAEHVGSSRTDKLFLEQIHWVSTKYRAKSILGPLIISVIITIPFLIAIFYAK
jgi:hypothetical protein